MSKNYTDYQRITYQDVEHLLVSISSTTAKQYVTDIKKEFGVKVVLFCHFKEYFKITQIMPKSA